MQDNVIDKLYALKESYTHLEVLSCNADAENVGYVLTSLNQHFDNLFEELKRSVVLRGSSAVVRPIK